MINYSKSQHLALTLVLQAAIPIIIITVQVGTAQRKTKRGDALR